MALTGLAVANADDINIQENKPPAEYERTYDNIPADWEEFWLDDESIYGFLGEPIDVMHMTKLIYGKSGDGVQLAGGAFFTVISPKMILVQDESTETLLVEFRFCKELDRARYIFLRTKQVDIKFRRNSGITFMTAQSRGFMACPIEEIYKWHGPTFYIEDINRPERTYRDMSQIRRDKGTRIGRLGH